MTKIRVTTILITLIVIIAGSLTMGLWARGFRLDSRTFKVSTNGLLSVKSNPEAAQVFINGKLETATNNTLTLSPNTYDIEIKKDGYQTWSKRITVEKEIVSLADAFLFRLAPSLSAITFDSSTSPVASDDYSKIAYANPTGLWVIETVNLPIGFSRDPRKITDGFDVTGSSWEWSPNGREILLTTKSASFLLDSGKFTSSTQRVNIQTKVAETRSLWAEERQARLDSQVGKIPAPLKDILGHSTLAVSFSPDENMVLYTSNTTANLPDNLITQLPGSSTQKQDRDIKPGKTYVYDIKEDRNFLILDDTSSTIIDGFYPDNISPTSTPAAKSTTKTPEAIKYAFASQKTTSSATGAEKRLVWFPTSKHLVLAEPEKISVMDYDGTNKKVVYSGSFISPHAFPITSTDKLVILTNLGASSSPANLYSLSIR